MLGRAYIALTYHLLYRVQLAALNTPLSLAQQLSAVINGDYDKVRQLFNFLERQEIPPGARIVTRGKPSDALFFIESGQVTTKTEEFGEYFLHLETMRNGRVIGDIGFYLKRPYTADVITTEKCILYRLTTDNLKNSRIIIRKLPQCSINSWFACWLIGLVIWSRR